MSILTHCGRRQTGRQRQDQNGGRQMDPTLKDAGAKSLEGAKNRKRERGKDHEEHESQVLSSFAKSTKTNEHKKVKMRVPEEVPRDTRISTEDLVYNRRRRVRD